MSRRKKAATERASARAEGAGGSLLRLLCAGLLASTSCAAPAESEPPLRVFGPFEAALDVPIEGANPFDPEELSVTVAFESPSGATTTVPAFATRDYSRELEGGVERLSPAGEIGFRVRFTPTEAGTWRFRTTVERPGERVESAWTELEVAERGSRHGFVRLGGESRTALRFDDGTPYLAIGENLAWYDGRGTFAYDEWLEAIAAHGGTYARLWMPSWAFGLEWVERDGEIVASSLGDYGARLDRAWQLDHVLGRAEELGVHVVLCLQNHGPFSLEHNSEWGDNPYNAANGGPLAEPADFFTDEEARELFRRRLRYVVARWGYSPNVLAFELWNEVDMVVGSSPEAVASWHEEMSAALRELDPNDHLVTTSLSGVEAALDMFGSSALYDALWSLPGIDLVQLHFYTTGDQRIDFGEVLPGMVERLRAYGKPVLVAEAGVDYRGGAETLESDPESVVFHDLLWQGVLLGTFGTGMSWWWDSVTEPEDLYSHFDPVAAFVRGVDFDGERFEASTAGAASPTAELRTTALVGETAALVWVENARHQWYAPDDSVIEDATLTVDDLPPGRWSATWIDTSTAERLSRRSLTVDAAAVELAVPPFARDVALRLDLD